MTSTRGLVSILQSRHTFAAWQGRLGVFAAQGLLAAVLLSSEPAGAQSVVVPDTQAPSQRRALVDAANGVPVVHISPANSAGVSHNVFQRLDVGTNGVVLNNISSGRASSVLAGSLGPNLLFAGNPAAQARLILAEVNGGVASQLGGRFEVLGARSDLVLANPFGISCNGCGFINVDRATLAVGRPLFDGPQLRTLSVDGGTLGVGGAGLQAPGLGSLTLLAGKVDIQAPVTLQQGNSAIYAWAGAGRVDHETLAVAPQARVGAAPAHAIDIGAAAGMYADRIFLVTNEHGPGVRIAGQVEARGGGLTIDAPGSVVTLPGALLARDGGSVVGSAWALNADLGRIEADELLLFETQASIWGGETKYRGRDIVLSSGEGLLFWNTDLKALRDLRIGTRNGIDISAGTLTAGADLSLRAGSDLVLGVKANAATYTNNGVFHEQLSYARTTLDAGGDVTLQSVEDTVLDGTLVSAGGGIAMQGRNVALQARKDLLKTARVDGGWTIEPSRETLVGVKLAAGSDISLLASSSTPAQGNLVTFGARIESANGHVSLLGSGDVDIAHDITTDRTYERFYDVKRKWYGSKRITEIIRSTVDELVNPGEISGRSVSIAAGGDLNLVGSALFADGAIGLHADRDLSLLSTEEEHYAYESRSTRKSGIFSGGGLGFTIGSRSHTQIEELRSTRQASSSVASLAGDILASAGRDYLQLSSDITAPMGDIHVEAQNIAIQSANHTRSVLNIIRDRQSGLTLGASHPLVSAAQSVYEMSRVAKRTDSGRYAALAMLTSGLTIYNAFQPMSAQENASNRVGADWAGFKFSATLGTSSSDYEALSRTTTPQESALNAGRDISLKAVATGNAPADGSDTGDISIVGARLSASRDMRLAASRDITLAAAIGTSNSQSRSRSTSASVGVTYGMSAGQVTSTLNLSASRSNAWSTGWGTTYFNSELAAGQQLHMDSGRHTTLSGAKASGNRVDMLVGSNGQMGQGSGNLSITSPIDQEHYRSREQSSGFGVSIPIPAPGATGSSPPSLQINGSYNHLLANWESVRRQSAIMAGSGGFGIRVNGHVHLKGGAISSEAPFASNLLLAETLSHQDIVNQDRAVGQGLSVGLNITATDIKGSSVGFARVDTTRTSDTFSSLAPGNFYLDRQDLHGQRVAELRAQQRAPDEQALARQQRALVELQLREPPRCTGCMPQQAEASGTNATNGTNTGTGLIPTAGQTAAGNTNPAWLAWQQAVWALEQDIQRLQGRLAALGQEHIKAWDTLSRSPDSLHQPLLHTFDAGKATQEMRDGVAVTAAFGTQAYKAVGDWSKQQLADAMRACGTAPTEACMKDAKDRWGEGGRYKVLLHAIVGTLATGKAGGVVGASLEALSPAITQAVVAAGFPDGTFLHNALVAGVKAAVGQGLDGTQTAAVMFNADANNRQLHPDETKYLKRQIERWRQLNPGLTSAQAEQELTRGALYDADLKWRAHFEEWTQAEVAQYQRAADFLRTRAAADGFKFSNLDGRLQAGFTSTPEQRAASDYLLELAFKDPLTRQLYGNSAMLSVKELGWTGAGRLLGTGAFGLMGGVSRGMEDTLESYVGLVQSATDVQNVKKLKDAVQKLAGKSFGALVSNIVDASLSSGDAALRTLWLGWMQSDSQALGHKAGEILGATLVDVLAQSVGLGVIRTAGRVVDGVGDLSGNLVRRVESSKAQADNNAKIVAAPVAGAPRVFNGVEVHPNMLGDPAAGWGYTPKQLSGGTPANQASQVVGFVTELEVARHLAEQGLLIVRWGDKSGTKGSDVIAVNPANGEVLLVDTKYRTQPQTLPHSRTFDFDPATNPRWQQQLDSIQDQARRAIAGAQLPTHIRDAAVAKMDASNFSTITVGAGNVRNNSFVRFCGGQRC